MTEQQNKPPRPARVAAIDPGSRKAGMVLLEIQPPAPGFIVPNPEAVAVLERHTARPRFKDDFALRMCQLADALDRWASGVEVPLPPDLWCVEDPRDFPLTLLRGRGAAVSLGAAFGVASAVFGACAKRCGTNVLLVPAQEWYPRTRTNHRVHPMRHNAAREFLRARWPALQPCTDDEVFASGVALWAYTKGAMAATYPI